MKTGLPLTLPRFAPSTLNFAGNGVFVKTRPENQGGLVFQPLAMYKSIFSKKLTF